MQNNLDVWDRIIEKLTPKCPVCLAPFRSEHWEETRLTLGDASVTLTEWQGCSCGYSRQVTTVNGEWFGTMERQGLKVMGRLNARRPVYNDD